MTVYVDDMLRPAQVGRGRPGKWSHLMADTHDELEAFARQLGLRPTWIQRAGTPLEHYDVTSTVRERALRLGATPMKYGREGGLFTLLKSARMRGDEAAAADYAARLAAERGQDGDRLPDGEVITDANGDELEHGVDSEEQS